MDEELRTYLDAMRRELNDAQERTRREFNDGQERTRREFNDAQERLLNRVASLEQDFQNTKGFLVVDALVAGRRGLDLEERVSRLERDRKAGH